MSTPITALESIWYHQILTQNLIIHPESRCLEIGVGSGYSAIHLSKKVHEIIGIDVSEPLVKYLNHFVKKHSIGRIKFIEGDICEDSFLLDHENSFDIALCADVFEHVNSIQKMLSNLLKVLKKNGQLVMTFPLIPGHGRLKAQTSEDIENYFDPKVWERKIFIVRPRYLYHLVHDHIYLRIRKIFKRFIGAKKDEEYKSKEDIFHEFSCFEIMTNPTWINRLAGIVVRALFWFCSLLPTFSLEPFKDPVMNQRFLVILKKK